MKKCLECKKEFEPKSQLAAFCSNKCRQKAYRKNVSELLKEARNGKIVSAKVIKEDGQHKAEIKIELPEFKEKDIIAIATNATKNKPKSEEFKKEVYKANIVYKSEKPQKMEGEDSIDYAFRVNEWKKLNK